MKAKEYMQQAYFLDKRINSLVRQMDNLLDQATNISQVISDMPQNMSGGTSRVADFCGLTDEIRRQIQKLEMLRKEIMMVVSKVPNPEYQLILQEKYLEMLTWKDLSSDMNRSIRSAQLMHARALDEVQKVLDRK